MRFFNSISKFFLIIFLIFISIPVVAQDNNKTEENLSGAFSGRRTGWSSSLMGYETQNPKSVEEIVGIVISSILSFLGVIFMAFIIYGGILWMTAEGNDQQVEKAQKILKQATVGLIVVLVSYSLSWLVLNIFVNPGPNIPSN